MTNASEIQTGGVTVNYAKWRLPLALALIGLITVSVYWPVLQNGFTPVFVDINPRNLCMAEDQVLAKLNAYRALGIEAFILSGYPHAAEADLFARHVLPRIDHGPLALESGAST